MNCRVQTWTQRVLLVLAACSLVLSSCTTPRKVRSAPTEDGYRGAPAWAGQPEGWSKLEQIQRWLQSDAQRYDSYWQLQGELALAEGRLAFCRDEAGSAASGRSSWSARLQAARSGFQRVAAHPDASDSQRSRAAHGLGDVAGLDGGSSGPAAAPGDVQPRSAWRASRPIASRLTRASGGYNKITVHHTADISGARFDGSLRDSTQTLRQVQSEHMDGRGYGDIGYHYLIDPAGRVFEGRSLSYQGAHAGGVRNRQNIGICLLGNFETRRPTPQAISALTELLAELRRENRIERDQVFCHRELKSTLCPGAHLASWTTDYRRTGPSLSSLGGESRAPAKPTPSSSRQRTARAASVSVGSRSTVR